MLLRHHSVILRGQDGLGRSEGSVVGLVGFGLSHLSWSGIGLEIRDVSVGRGIELGHSVLFGYHDQILVDFGEGGVGA